MANKTKQQRRMSAIVVVAAQPMSPARKLYEYHSGLRKVSV